MASADLEGSLWEQFIEELKLLQQGKLPENEPCFGLFFAGIHYHASEEQKEEYTRLSEAAANRMDYLQVSCNVNQYRDSEKERIERIKSFIEKKELLEETKGDERRFFEGFYDSLQAVADGNSGIEINIKAAVLKKGEPFYAHPSEYEPVLKLAGEQIVYLNSKKRLAELEKRAEQDKKVIDEFLAANL